MKTLHGFTWIASLSVQGVNHQSLRHSVPCGSVSSHELSISSCSLDVKVILHLIIKVYEYVSKIRKYILPASIFLFSEIFNLKIRILHF